MLSDPATPDTSEAGSVARAEIRAGCLHVLRPDGSVAFAEARPPDLRRGVRLAFQLAADEQLYGWGEQFGAFARTRGRLWLHAFNTPLDPPAPPQLLGRPVLPQPEGVRPAAVERVFYALAHRPSPANELSVEARGGAADYLVILGETPKDILTTYTELTGRPPLLPRWAFGLWGTGYPQEHQDRVVELARQHRQHGYPAGRDHP